MKIINSDLLTVTDGLIVHQVNCIGVTGGLAGALRRAHPKAFRGYDWVCLKFGKYSLGLFLVEPASPTLSICHIFGQVKPGPNTDLEAVEKALIALSERIDFVPSDLYLPFGMGCGLGGGDWKLYSELIEKHLPLATILKKY